MRGSVAICARLSTWKTPIVSARWSMRVDRRVVGREMREVDLDALVLADERDRLLERRQHAEAEQVDLDEARGRRSRPCPTG